MSRRPASSSSGSGGAVASADPLASAAGVRILKRGGNAVDAAVATSLALGVVGPALSGIGGGGFFLVRLRGGETLYIDYREVAPRGARPDMFPLDEAGSPVGQANAVGHLAVGVPGTVAGLTYALENYGTMKFRDVAAPAIEYAKRGYRVSRFLAYILSRDVSDASSKLRRFPESRREWFRGGRPPRAGSIKRSGNLAQSLELVARDGREVFYRGVLARAIAREMDGNGGRLDEADLGVYDVKVRKPVTGSYRGLEVHSMPPPSIGGIAIIELLNVFESMDLKRSGLNTAQTISAMARTISAVWPPLRAQVGDPDFVNLGVTTLTSKKYSRSLVSPRGRPPSRAARGPGSQTTHLSVIDGERNVAAVTESVECYFGSGVTVPGTGVVLNDTMHDFDPAPGGPNSIEPGKRPVSNMVPTLLLRDSEPYLVLGSAGSARIVTSTLQTILDVVDHSLDIKDAVAAPRFHYQGSGPIMMESRIGDAVRLALRADGYDTETPEYVQLRPGFDVYFGGVHAVMVGPRGELRAAADPRRWGAAAAF